MTASSEASFVGNVGAVSAFGSLAEHICAIERSRIRAILARDMDVLWKLHAPDYELITPPGRTWIRQRYLDAIECGQLAYLQWKVTGEMLARIGETLAAVRYQVVLEVGSDNSGGTPFLCWHTDMYELWEQSWQAVWSQATAIRDAQPS